MQIHGGDASKQSQGCGDDGRLKISNQDYLAILITSAAEMPGLLVAALLIDVLGRRRQGRLSSRRHLGSTDNCSLCTLISDMATGNAQYHCVCTIL